MKTLELTKYQARQALNSFKYANDDLKGKDIEYLEHESKFDESLSNYKKKDNNFLYIRNSQGSRYEFVIDSNTMTLNPNVKINKQDYNIDELKEFLADLTPEEQKKNLENLYTDDFEKYLSKEVFAKTKEVSYPYLISEVSVKQ